jgi:hypothetical protein
MKQLTLSGIVRRRFVHCVNSHHQSVRDVIRSAGITPGEMCQIITDQLVDHLPLQTYNWIAAWLKMPLANVVALAGARPKLQDLVRTGMEIRGYRVTSTQDQITAAAEIGISVAVFRRALHGYADFSPSIRTCDRLAAWLAWTGFEPDDIVTAAGMIVRYRPDGRRVVLSPDIDRQIKPYPCACGRAGCMIPAHIPSGPRRKWRSDACRMWAKRQAAPKTHQRTIQYRIPSRLPQLPPIVRFIMINERPVPVRF